MAYIAQLLTIVERPGFPVSCPKRRGTVTGRVHFLLGWVQMSDLVVLCDWLRTRIVVYTRWRGACAACSLLLVGRRRHCRAHRRRHRQLAAPVPPLPQPPSRPQAPPSAVSALPRQYGAPWIAQALCSCKPNEIACEELQKNQFEYFSSLNALKSGIIVQVQFNS